jgi:hypothetical protein
MNVFLQIANKLGFQKKKILSGDRLPSQSARSSAASVSIEPGLAKRQHLGDGHPER